MKSCYRRYKIGELVNVKEREYNAGNDPNHKSVMLNNTYKVVQDYPLFVVCERKAKNDSTVTIRTSFLKWDLEHGTV